MAESLKDRLTSDMKLALKAGDKSRLGTIRMALAEIKRREVDDQTTLSDEQVTGVVEKMVKQRRDALTQFRDAGRDDLADTEAAEIEVLKGYLPEPLGEAELTALIDQIIADTGASSMKDMGSVMGRLKGQVAGRADMGQVSQLVRARLG
ncbi:MAG: GatB/YqeY domain-containing protein [Pseudomonadota bacterium]